VRDLHQKYSTSFATLWQHLSPPEVKSQLEKDKKFDAIFDQNFTEFESFYIILQSSLRVAVRELEKSLDEAIGFARSSAAEELAENLQDKVITLDYLVTYFQLTTLILDEFNQPDHFASKSKIE
jgi:SNF-related kinase